MRRRLPRPFLVLFQTGVILGVAVLLAFSPPRHGAFLLVPWSGEIGLPVRVALDHDARLLGTGPLPGSVIVMGERAALAPAARSSGVLVLAAPFIGCGSASPSAA